MTPENRLKKILNRDNLILFGNRVFGLFIAHKSIIAGGLFLCILLLALPAWLSTKPNTKSHSLNNLSTKDTSLTVAGKLSVLDESTPLALTFNVDVDTAVSRFMRHRAADIPSITEASLLYFPIIETYLDKYGLPIELKYLAILESGLNPRAKSPSGAVGIWQFLYNTCSLVDLQVNSYIDERCDIHLSTDAACRYLSYLYRIFNNWELAIAAYNCGPGDVQKAMERSGGKINFWEIKPYLPKETANYLPMFIALNYIFAETTINAASKANTAEVLDTVWILQSMSFNEITKHTGIPKEELERLNPKYSQGFIPVSAQYADLNLTAHDRKRFIRNEHKLYSKNRTLKKKTHSTELHPKSDSLCVVYSVQPGDFYHKLAMSFGCTAAEIKHWNNTTTNVLVPGQLLKIWLPNKNQP